MKLKKQPVWMTIVFGLACALGILLVSMVPRYIIYPTLAFRFAIWGFLACYGLFLTRWSGVRFTSVLFPLMIPIPVVFLNNGTPTFVFLILCLLILSWIRSGICFPSSWTMAIIAEVLICFGGASLVTYFSPYTPLGWALAVWMFFLVQSLYFILFSKHTEKSNDDDYQTDPFENARRKAEEILSASI